MTLVRRLCATQGTRTPRAGQQCRASLFQRRKPLKIALIYVSKQRETIERQRDLGPAFLCVPERLYLRPTVQSQSSSSDWRPDIVVCSSSIDVVRRSLRSSRSSSPGKSRSHCCCAAAII